MGTKRRRRRLLTPAFTDALQYAAELHAGQQRKGAEPVPYVGHLIGVASMVLELGGTETAAIAALLHDAVEDQPRGGRTIAEIRARFGADVARIVLACTDTVDAADARGPESWRRRKEHYLAHLADRRPDELFVSLADKLHNVRKILADLHRQGDAVWDRFNGRKDGTLWYYAALGEAFRTAPLPPRAVELLEDFEHVVAAMHRIGHAEAGIERVGERPARSPATDG